MNTYFRTILLVVLGAFLATNDAQAQIRLEEGMRARLTLLLRNELIVGRLAVASPDSIALVDDAGRRRAYPYHDLRKLDVYSGRHSRMGRSALAGGVIGAALGGLIL